MIESGSNANPRVDALEKTPSRASRDDAGRDDDGARWRLEDGIGATRARLCGALLFALGVAVFVGATIAALSFVDGEADDAFRYYSLIVPVTLPATIIFVYLNWLSVSFFKTA